MWKDSMSGHIAGLPKVGQQRRSNQVLGTMWTTCALKECTTVVSGCCKVVLRQVLESWHEGVQAGDDVKETRSLKMFCLLPFIADRQGSKAELCRRFDQFSEGQWRRLHEGFRDIRSESTRRPVVRLGEVSRARQCLVGAALAPTSRFQGIDRRSPQL